MSLSRGGSMYGQGHSRVSAAWLSNRRAGGRLLFESADWSYEPDRADGQRLSVSLDGRNLVAAFHDWCLVPLVHYADSDDRACFTFFGHLLDADMEEQVRERGGKIVNYHRAFQNTLLGLRLMQIDLLLMYPDCAELPQQDGRYILGAGESPPDVAANTN